MHVQNELRSILPLRCVNLSMGCEQLFVLLIPFFCYLFFFFKLCFLVFIVFNILLVDIGKSMYGTFQVVQGPQCISLVKKVKLQLMFAIVNFVP